MEEYRHDVGDHDPLRLCCIVGITPGFVMPAFLIIRPIMDELIREDIERLTGRSLEQVIEQRAANIYYLLDLVDEARKLMQTIFPE